MASLFHPLCPPHSHPFRLPLATLSLSLSLSFSLFLFFSPAVFLKGARNFAYETVKREKA